MKSTYLIFILAIVTLSHAQFTTNDNLHRTTIQSYGGAEDHFSTHLKLAKHDRLLSAHVIGIDRNIATRVIIHPVRTATGYNLTTSVEMDGKLGFTSFRLVAKTVQGRRFELPGSIDVIGVRFAKPVVRQTARMAAVSAQVYGGKNAPRVRLTDCRLAVTGRNAFLKNEDVAVSGNTLLLRPTARNGKNAARISVDCPGIGGDGENAENELSIEPDVRLTEDLTEDVTTTSNK